MSEPVSHAEVEDVLASIRRLVSEEKRPSIPESGAVPETDPDDVPGKLMLTAALRVADHNDVAPDTETTKEPVRKGRTFVFAPSTPEDALDDALQTPDDTIETAQTPMEEAADFNEPQDDVADNDVARFDDADEETADDVSEDADDTVSDNSANETQGADDITHVNEPEALRPGIDVPISLSAKIAALEAVIGKKSDQWEPDGVAEDPYSGTEDPTMAWEDHAPGSEFDGEAEAEAEAAVEDVLVDADNGPTIEEIEEAPFVEDVTPEDVENMAAPDFEPDARIAEDAVADAADDIADDAAKSILSADVDVLDEDVLRDMVADIVRQELQGALGERITRNVRKLVRREIHRALATQDLE